MLKALTKELDSDLSPEKKESLSGDRLSNYFALLNMMNWRIPRDLDDKLSAQMKLPQYQDNLRIRRDFHYKQPQGGAP